MQADAGDLTQQAWAHYYLAWGSDELSDSRTAMKHNREAADLFDAAGDAHGVVQNMLSLALHLVRIDKAPQALAETSRARAYLAGARDRMEPHIVLTTTITLHSLTDRSHGGLGHCEEAATHLETAAGLSCTNGLPTLEGFALFYLGEVWLTAGREANALHAFPRCLARTPVPAAEFASI
ncbi:hypothetical protein [Streptomyces zhihengii]|uniref:hypothetical protein n=1 Tax=Streptomyces zhihengii TaxID=1818004 RepID=UPI0033A86109